MYPYLMHIYGPLYINSYGLMIALAILIFIKVLLSDSRCTGLITHDQLMQGVIIGTIAGLIGARILWVLTNAHELNYWWEFFEIWNGGLSVLGAIIVLLPVLIVYMKRHGLPVLPVLDIVSTYAALLQGVSRIGCFLSGCCYGKHAFVPWAITYVNPHVNAPLGIALHPTQLYSSLVFCGIFIIMTLVVRKNIFQHGVALCIYLMLSSAERFFIDFFRGDREFMDGLMTVLSFNQVIALGIMVLSAVALVYLRTQNSYYTAQSL
jgi:phosphatidylglycerol---prolipoprotein diacylglyceryl transferase